MRSTTKGTTQVFHLELHTANGTEAGLFLAALLGWPSGEVTAGGSRYVSLGMGDRIDGGIVQCGASPAQWVPYVSVENLDASSERAAELGADVLLAPREGPYGWRSVVNSPVGGMMGLWQPKSNPWNQSNPWKRRGLK